MKRKGEFLSKGDVEDRKDMIDWNEAKYSSGAQASFEEYCQKLGLPVDEWAGKRVLDIGSGLSELFAEGARKLDINVISQNPVLADNSMVNIRKRLARDHESTGGGQTVAALAQELPYKDESFDAEVSLFAVPGYLPEYVEQYRKTFNEIIRTLKPGGKAYLFPILPEMEEDPKFNALVDELSTVATVDFQEVEGNSRKRMVITKNETEQ